MTHSMSRIYYMFTEIISTKFTMAKYVRHCSIQVVPTFDLPLNLSCFGEGEVKERARQAGERQTIRWRQTDRWTGRGVTKGERNCEV